MASWPVSRRERKAFLTSARPWRFVTAVALAVTGYRNTRRRWRVLPPFYRAIHSPSSTNRCCPSFTVPDCSITLRRHAGCTCAALHRRGALMVEGDPGPHPADLNGSVNMQSSSLILAKAIKTHKQGKIDENNNGPWAFTTWGGNCRSSASRGLSPLAPCAMTPAEQQRRCSCHAGAGLSLAPPTSCGLPLRPRSKCCWSWAFS